MMRRAKVYLLLLWFCSFWNGFAHGKTYTSVGKRLSLACKGFARLNKTILCTPCSSTCINQFQLADALDDQWHGVIIDPSNQNCTQIQAENGTIVCFENKLLDDEHGIIIDDHRLKDKSPIQVPYIGMHTMNFMKFIPLDGIEPNLPDFTIPTIPFAPEAETPSVVVNHGLLVCDESSLQTCYHWSFRGLMVRHQFHYSNEEWVPMSKLKQPHHYGGLSNLGGRPIVIGGKVGEAQTTSVEIFDSNCNSWIDGPQLNPARSHVSVVQISSRSIVIIGGYPANALTKTELLSVGSSDWTKLEDRPEGSYFSACALVKLGNRRGILSAGGSSYDNFLSTTYFLDLSTLTWTHEAHLDAPLPVYSGTLFQWHNEIHFIPLTLINWGTPDKEYFVKNLHEEGQGWENRTYPFEGMGATAHLLVNVMTIFNITTV